MRLNVYNDTARLPKPPNNINPIDIKNSTPGSGTSGTVGGNRPAPAYPASTT